ncbi:hypothetical protein H6G89_06180 [Oscillatoria sp. FACHB-1407]|uniref:hypothetical protein n=1 Tax=Oscillatoria sp. FACHB-1407 TaxID=2692847 RepID=UPI001686A299|nr:hypothetical protein [Oscillatoria sp. FACHB-1407]MBD2460628.1 hypothetical protein [Oscillatoria sp. FACHB-1407]
MLKPVQGMFITALVLLVSCASNPSVESPASTSPAATAPSPSPEASAPQAAVASAPAAEPEAEIDTTVVPGERVGPITRDTTRDDLVTLFGEDNLKDETVSIGEGESEVATIVYPDSERSLTVIWTDDTRSKLAAVINLGSAWKTPEGIGVGTSFTELQEKLGEFQLYGFDWDYAGTIVLEGSDLADYEGLLVLRVEPAENAAETAPSNYEAVMGDQLFPSTDPNFEPLGIKVGEMAVSLDPEQ